MFAIHGLPETMLSDNGTVFTSKFSELTEENWIRQLRTGPYHTASNSQMESGTHFQGAMKRALQTSLTDNATHYDGSYTSRADFCRLLKSHLSLGQIPYWFEYAPG